MAVQEEAWNHRDFAQGHQRPQAPLRAEGRLTTALRALDVPCRKLLCSSIAAYLDGLHQDAPADMRTSCNVVSQTPATVNGRDLSALNLTGLSVFPGLTSSSRTPKTPALLRVGRKRADLSKAPRGCCVSSRRNGYVPEIISNKSNQHRENEGSKASSGPKGQMKMRGERVHEGTPAWSRNCTKALL
ncbi:uncharacterized protein LOC144004097 [Festucalex cinctus]